jgi:hypothetical protein
MNKSPDLSSEKPVEEEVSTPTASQIHNEADSVARDPATERISAFFTRWAQFPNHKSECFSDADLVLIAQEQNRIKWPKHVQECSICGNVVHLIQNSTSERIPIVELLAKASIVSKGDYLTARPGKSSSLGYLRGFYRGLHPSAIAVAAIVLLAFVSAAVWYGTRSKEQSKASYSVALNEDPYWKTEQWFRASVDIMQDSSLSLEKKVANLAPLKPDYGLIEQTVASIPSSNLDPVRRADLAKLLTEYNSQTKLLRAYLQKSRTGSSFEVKDVQPSTDSKIVTEICAAVNVKTDSSAVNKEEQDIQDAKAVIEGAKQLNFASVDNQQIIVQDLIENRSLSDRKEIGERIRAIENTTNVKITLSVEPVGARRGFVDSRAGASYQDATVRPKKRE